MDSSNAGRLSNPWPWKRVVAWLVVLVVVPMLLLLGLPALGGQDDAGVEAVEAQSSLYAQNSAIWPRVYAQRRAILGETGSILAFGDRGASGRESAAVIKSVAFDADLPPLAWSVEPRAMSLWRTPLNLDLAASWKGSAPMLFLDGLTETMTSAPEGYWSRTTGAQDLPFTVGAWVNPDPRLGSTGIILAKYHDLFGGGEWIFEVFQSDTVMLYLRDWPVASVYAGSGHIIPKGRWSLLVCGYDGRGGSNAASGIACSVNGVRVPMPIVTVEGTYQAMRPSTAPMELGERKDDVHFKGGMLGGPWGPFIAHLRLTPAQEFALWETERVYIGE